MRLQTIDNRAVFMRSGIITIDSPHYVAAYLPKHTMGPFWTTGQVPMPRVGLWTIQIEPAKFDSLMQRAA